MAASTRAISFGLKSTNSLTCDLLLGDYESTAESSIVHVRCRPIDPDFSPSPKKLSNDNRQRHEDRYIDDNVRVRTLSLLEPLYIVN
jgi:hypothetical protein